MAAIFGVQTLSAAKRAAKENRAAVLSAVPFLTAQTASRSGTGAVRIELNVNRYNRAVSFYERMVVSQ